MSGRRPPEPDRTPQECLAELQGARCALARAEASGGDGGDVDAARERVSAAEAALEECAKGWDALQAWEAEERRRGGVHADA